MHCGKPMLLSYRAGDRINFVCANQCGHREYDGPIAVKKPQPLLGPVLRPCEECGKPLPWKAHIHTKYHGHCASVVKRRQQKAYQQRVAKAAR